jgi:hypothetical protein
MRLHRLIGLVLVTQLLAAPVAAGMLVLCIGSDGHVSVEYADGGPCCREWRAARQRFLDHSGQTLEPATGPCCSDVELLIESATLTVSSQKLIPTASVQVSTPISLAPSSGIFAANLPFSAESPTAKSLRTVVLQA